MSSLIYRRILSHEWVKTKDQMLQAEREALLAKLDETLQKVGGKRLIFIECDSDEALRQWDTLGTEIFPDMQAVQEYLELLKGLDGIQYIETTSEIGTGTDFEKWLTT